jgi:hypothetical protein
MRRTTARRLFITRFKKGASGNPRGRPVKNLAGLLAVALNEKVAVTENGKRRRMTKREAVIAQLVDKSASAQLRAAKMLIEMLCEIDRKTDPARPSIRQVHQPRPSEEIPMSHFFAVPRKRLPQSRCKIEEVIPGRPTGPGLETTDTCQYVRRPVFIGSGLAGCARAPERHCFEFSGKLGSRSRVCRGATPTSSASRCHCVESPERRKYRNARG